MLETVIDRFAKQGFRRFWLCVHYKAELIEGYFGNGSARGLKIRYTHETEPLGTAGALKLLPVFEVPFIVCNADILADIDYGALMEAHARSNADATACASLYQHQVPFGVMEVDETSRLTGLKEKPIENFQVLAGVYVLDPKAMESLPEGRCDMPDLLGKISVNVFEIEGPWMDIGRFEDYSRAQS